MPWTEVALVIARWQPASLPAEVAVFAKKVVTKAAPTSAVRAKALLFAAGKLGTFATSLGVELAPELALSPSLIERFIVTEAVRFGPATRRTLRSNLRFLSGLIALGAGAGLMGVDLRTVRGSDVVRRSGGVVVEVTGRRARVVPVLARYHERLVTSACFARGEYVTGGFSASRRNVTSGLAASLAGGADLPTLDVGRLRATWLHEVAGVIGLKAFLDAAGIVCSQRLGDLVATVATPTEPKAVTLLGARAQ